MLLNLYSVFDSKADSYLAPFTSSNHATATRQFHTAVLEPTHDFHIHSEDYALFHVGTFNSSSAEITGSRAPICIAKAHELLANSYITGSNDQ